MTERKIISSDNLRLRFPLISTIVFALLLDKLNSPGWVWVVVGTLFAIIWLIALKRWSTSGEVEVDIFKEEKDPNQNK